MFSELIKTSTARIEEQYNDALKLFTTFANTLKGFQVEYQEAKTNIFSGVEEIITSFIYKNIKILCSYLEHFSSIKELQELFIQIIQTSIKICGAGLNQFYNTILVSTLTTFELHPIENVRLLELMHTILFYFESSQEQQYWIQHNFSKFNQFIMNLLDQNKNASIISRWIDVLYRVYELHSDFFFSLPELETIIVLLIQIFYEPQGPDLLKKLVQILNCFIGTASTIQNPTFSQYIPKILEITFQKLCEIEPYRVKLISPIILSVLEGVQQEDLLINLFLTALSHNVYQNISDDQKKTFLEAIHRYQKNDLILNALLKHFSEYAQDPVQNADSMLYVQKKLLEKSPV